MLSNNLPGVRRRLLRVAVGAGAVTAFLLTGCSGQSGGDDEGITLTVASWGGAFSGSIMDLYAEPFEEETGIKLEVVDAPGQFVAGVQAQKDAGSIEWDVLDSISAPDAYIMDAQGLTSKMPEDVRASLTEVMGDVPVKEFGMAYSNLGYILGCVEDAVQNCPSSTAEGFFNAQKYPGERTSIASAPMINLTLAEIAAGVPVSETGTHEIDLDRAFETLDSIRDEVTVWWDSSDQVRQILSNGEASMGVLYSAEPYQLTMDFGVPVTPVWDGGLYNPGYMQVVADSPHEEAAWQFIEWLGTHPEIQAQWAEVNLYSVPNPEAFDFIDEETAKMLVDNPQNRELLAEINYQWYVEHVDEVNDRWQEFLRK